jgi:hypothetical protein
MGTISKARSRAVIGSGAGAIVLLLFASSGAQAQCNNTLPTIPVGDNSADFVPFARGGSVSSLVSVLNTTSTAFLNQTKGGRSQ